MESEEGEEESSEEDGSNIGQVSSSHESHGSHNQGPQTPSQSWQSRKRKHLGECFYPSTSQLLPTQEPSQLPAIKMRKQKSTFFPSNPMTQNIFTHSGNEKSCIRSARIWNEGGHVSASHTHCFTYIGTSDKAKESLRMDTPKAKEAVRQFINHCNEASRKKTEDKVTLNFDHLNTPNNEVNPGFQCVSFYKGDTSLASDEYIPDDLYVNHTKRVFKGKATKLKNFFENDENYTALVADAGAGKTVTAKRFTRLVIKGKIKHLKDIKLVHFVTLAELDCDGEHNAFDLLFKATDGLTEEMRAYGMQWVKNNSSEILLVLDGLDQTSWSLKDEVSTISFEEPSHSSKVIQNILKKHLLPDCKILLTSREHAIKNFLSNIRPHKIVALTGLSNKDRDYLIVSLGGEEKGQRILDHLNQKSPGLLSLCATLVFNVFTVAILGIDLKNAPSTMSEILMRVLVCFLNSNNRREKEMYWIFTKLKELAYNGTHQKRILFRKEEITSLGMGVNQVNDLVIITPLELPFEIPNLMEGYYRLFFCHQSVQDALTALFICEYPVEQFKQFVQDHLDDPHFSVVRKIIFGVILNPKMNIPITQEVIDAIPGKEEKIGILQEWLRNVLHHRNKNSRRDKSKQPWNIIKSKDLELYSILNECGVGATDVIKHNLQNVKFTQRQLRADTLYVLCTVLAQCENLCKLELGEVIPCDKDIHLLEICILLAEQVKIAKMRLHKGVERARFVQLFRKTSSMKSMFQGNNEVPKEDCKIEKSKFIKVSQVNLGLCHCEEDCNFLSTIIDFFPAMDCIILSFKHDNETINFEISEFECSSEIEGSIKQPMLHCIGRIVKSFATAVQLKRTSKSEIEQTICWRLSGNISEPETFFDIASIIKEGGVEKFTLSSDSLDLTMAIQHEPRGSILELNSTNDTLNPKILRSIGELGKVLRVEKLNFSGCTFCGDQLLQLLERFPQLNVEILQLSLTNDNPEPAVSETNKEITRTSGVTTILLTNYDGEQLKKALTESSAETRNSDQATCSRWLDTVTDSSQNMEDGLGMVETLPYPEAENLQEPKKTKTPISDISSKETVDPEPSHETTQWNQVQIYSKKVGRPQVKGCIGISKDTVHVGVWLHSEHFLNIEKKLKKDFEDLEAEIRLHFNACYVSRGDELKVKIFLEHPKSFPGISISPKSAIGFKYPNDFECDGTHQFEFSINSKPPTKEKSVPLLCIIEKNGELAERRVISWKIGPRVTKLVTFVHANKKSHVKNSFKNSPIFIDSTVQYTPNCSRASPNSTSESESSSSPDHNSSENGDSD